MKEINQLTLEDKELIESVRHLKDDGYYIIKCEDGSFLCDIDEPMTGKLWKEVVNKNYPK